MSNDGVTIAKEFDLQDAKENLGAQKLRQAAEKTGDIVGDGTSRPATSGPARRFSSARWRRRPGRSRKIPPPAGASSSPA